MSRRTWLCIVTRSLVDLEKHCDLAEKAIALASERPAFESAVPFTTLWQTCLTSKAQIFHL